MKPSAANLLAIALLALLMGCSVTDESKDQTVDPPRIQDPVDPVADLDFFEQELVGKWSRFHSYDGSTQYRIFNADRTACKFEIDDSGSREDTSHYVHWHLEPVAGKENVFKVMMQARPDSQLLSKAEYHYGPNEIHNGGYSNLKMYPSNTWRECE